jgi:hypothetical protein
MSERAVKRIADVRGVYKVRSEMYISPSAGAPFDPNAEKTLPDVPERTASAVPDRRTGMLPPLPGRLASNNLDQPKPVTLMAPVALPDGDVTMEIERIRLKDERYKQVRYEMKGGAVYVRGSGKPEHTMAFARAVSNLPGVERVVLQNSDPR